MKLLTFPQVAATLEMSPRTIKDWAYHRRRKPENFPKPVKIGSRLRYRDIDVDAWIAGLAPLPGEAETNPVPDGRRGPGRPRLGGGQ